MNVRSIFTKQIKWLCIASALFLSQAATASTLSEMVNGPAAQQQQYVQIDPNAPGDSGGNANATDSAQPGSSAATTATQAPAHRTFKSLFSSSKSQNFDQAAISSTKSDIQNLKKSMSSAESNSKMFQQLDIQQMRQLQQTNLQLQQEISQLQQAMVLIHQQMGSVALHVQSLQAENLANEKNNQASAKKDNPKSKSSLSSIIAAGKNSAVASSMTMKQWWASFFASVQFKLITGIIALAILALAWKLNSSLSNVRSVVGQGEDDATTAESAAKSTNKAATETAVEEDKDLETEYDFLNSVEAIPAKLDLARAYIAMDDHAAAKKVLSDVVQFGNDKQKKEAKDLSETMSEKSR